MMYSLHNQMHFNYVYDKARRLKVLTAIHGPISFLMVEPYTMMDRASLDNKLNSLMKIDNENAFNSELNHYLIYQVIPAMHRLHNNIWPVLKALMDNLLAGSKRRRNLVSDYYKPMDYLEVIEAYCKRERLSFLVKDPDYSYFKDLVISINKYTHPTSNIHKL
jgi:hypothetical protein